MTNVLLATLSELKRHVRKDLKVIRQDEGLFYLGQSPVDFNVYFVINVHIRRHQFLREQLFKR